MAVTVSKRLQRTFPGTPDQVGQARAWVAGLLPAACPRTAEIALVVSELVTNAIVHSVSGQGGTFAVQVELQDSALVLTVADQGPRPVPARREPGASGWGLADIVERLTEACDVVDGPAGRTVCCRLTWPATPREALR